MSLQPRQPPLWSAGEFLDAEVDGNQRHEFVNGAVFAMAGGSAEHGIITLNIASAVNSGAPETCQVFASDMKVRFRTETDERCYYPDVVVSCSAAEPDRYFRTEPVLLVEVFSPTTERTDRLEKLPIYKSIASVTEIALIAQANRTVELYRRRTGWAPELYGEKDRVTFESVGVAVDVSQIYRRIPPRSPW